MIFVDEAHTGPCAICNKIGTRVEYMDGLAETVACAEHLEMLREHDAANDAAEASMPDVRSVEESKRLIEEAAKNLGVGIEKLLDSDELVRFLDESIGLRKAIKHLADQPKCLDEDEDDNAAANDAEDAVGPSSSKMKEIVSELWADEAKRRWLGDRYGINIGNRWLFEIGLKHTVIDHTRLSEPGYVDGFLDDLDKHKRYGPKKQRDRWFEWSGDACRSFRNWVHREKKPKLSPEEQRKPFNRPQIRKWWDEWKKLSRGKRSLYHIFTPIEDDIGE